MGQTPNPERKQSQRTAGEQGMAPQWEIAEPELSILTSSLRSSSFVDSVPLIWLSKGNFGIGRKKAISADP